MSRFYRALQEAGRINPEPAEKPAEVKFEGGTPTTDAPLALDYAEVMRAIVPVAAVPGETPAPPNEAARNGAPESPVPAARVTLPETVGLGLPARVVLDRAARLIPHTADEAIVEYYRRLRAKIIQEQERKPFRSLMITSAAPQDGKSVTAMNLALSFGMLPTFRVLVVDGDLRKGSLGNWLGVGDHAGLSNLLEGSAELEDVVLKCDDIPVYFMVRGSSTTSPAELLHSSRLVPQFQKMTEHFSLVIVDSPPVNLLADAQLLAAGCDAVLLVARAFATTRKSVERAVQDLSPFRVIGTVLNRGMRAELYGHYRTYK
jgi:capsular exopolysaccharide synthesis family protein